MCFNCRLFCAPIPSRFPSSFFFFLLLSIQTSRSFYKGLGLLLLLSFRTARNEQSGGVIVFKREQIIASIHASRENTSIDRRCVFFFPRRDFARLSSRCVRWANKIPLIVRKNLEHVPQRIRLDLCYRKGS